MANLRQCVGEYGLYDKDITVIKKIGNIIKVANLKAIRKKGLVVNNKRIGNLEKLDNNLSRAKSKLKEYALCNEWDYFMTFTISEKCCDRYDLKAYYKKFSKFINNYNNRCDNDGDKVKYLFVPEKHEDGAWHLHGLLKGIKKTELYINEFGYLGWARYEEKFGFISFGRIKNIYKSANYIMKYITKDCNRNVTEIGAHMYYCSKGLNVGQEIYRGRVNLHTDWDFITENGYCSLKYFNNYDDFESCVEIL